MQNGQRIDIIMGVYNCQDTLAEAIESICAQTYSGWRMIMCDDGSTDASAEIARFYCEKYPKRFILLENKKNMGLNYTLNKCLSVCTAEYVARMDSDDLSDPVRFETQLKELDAHPELSFVSSNMLLFDENGVWGQTNATQFPLKQEFLRHSPFCHAAAMVRLEAYRAVGGYTNHNRLLRVEDYHLWIKMYEKGLQGKNIKTPLYKMRDNRDAQKRRNVRNRVNECYVKGYAVKHLNLPLYSYVYCLRPLVQALIPSPVYSWLHKRKLKSL